MITSSKIQFWTDRDYEFWIILESVIKVNFIATVVKVDSKLAEH